MPNDDDSPVTKRDLQELRTATHADMQQLRDDLIEKMREMQTEVLRAFYGWAKPVESRLRNVDEINSRLGLLEERVTAIEKRNFGL